MNWFTSLFSSSENPPSDPQVRDIIEQAIQVVDPRLKALPDYEKKLYPAAQAAWDHVCALTRSIPEPIEASPERWSITPELRAIFATPADISSVLSQSEELQQWSTSLAALRDNRVVALLAVQREERTRLGVSEEDGNVRRDVPLRTVNFTSHRVVCPVETPSDLRRQIKRRALHQLFLLALDRIQAIQSERQQLEEQKQMLQARLRILQQQGGELVDFLTTTPSPVIPAELAQKLEENTRQLQENRASLDTLDDYIELLKDTLSKAEQFLRAEQVQLTLNPLNVFVEPGANDGTTITLTDVCIARLNPITISLIPIICDNRQLVAPHCNLENAERFL